MKEIIYNNDKLTDDLIDEIVIRTKALMINSKQEILLGYSDNNYQFLGGHLEKNETLNECLKREILEETGMDIDTYSLKPFIKIIYYTKNYRNTDKNRKNIIYYYYIHTDLEYNMDKANLDEHEINDKFEIRKIELSRVDDILKDSIKDKENNNIIVNEMINVIDEYNKIK